MGAQQIIESLTARGFALAIVAGGIRVTPASALTDDDLVAIREHKPQLLALLSQAQAAGDSGQDERSQTFMSAGWPPGWATRIAEVLDLARQIPAGTRLGQLTIRDPERWAAALERDARDGPRGPRARTGALQEDLSLIAHHTTAERRNP